MNIFQNLRIYAGNWSVTGRRAFSEEEIAAIKDATVVPSNYGNSVCFTLVSGGRAFVPLANDANIGVGEQLDIRKAEWLTLSKDGESDITRVFI